MKKLIIWDFDGVIADTEKIWLKNRQILMKEALGIDWDWETVNHYLRGTGDKTKRNVLDSLGIITDDDFWDKSIEMDEDVMRNKGFALTDGIEEIFKMVQYPCRSRYSDWPCDRVFLQKQRRFRRRGRL